MTPDPDTREEVADAIRAETGAELVDFTRDVYQTMIVEVRSDSVGAKLTAVGEDAGYDVSTGADAHRLVFEARDRAPEKVSMGGNRL